MNNNSLKNKTWHIGINRYGNEIVNERHQNGFSDDLYIHFPDHDSVLIKYYAYSPSVGERVSAIKGTYIFDTIKNELSITLTEPEEHQSYDGGEPIQYPVFVFSKLSQDLKIKLITLPVISRYVFSIKSVDNDSITTRLILIDIHNNIHDFGLFSFDNQTEEHYGSGRR